MCAERVPRRRQRGISLIELIVFIVIVGVGLTGVLSVFNLAVARSADPMIRKQMLAIAESLMEEVAAQPFTYCDPADANAAIAGGAFVGAGGCATTVQGLGPGATETRSGAGAGAGATPFNNVADYANLATLNPITDVAGNGMYDAAYSATIAIAAGDVLGPAGSTLSPNDATAANLNLLRISVTVTRGTESLTLDGYRARHSPTAVP